MGRHSYRHWLQKNKHAGLDYSQWSVNTLDLLKNIPVQILLSGNLPELHSPFWQLNLSTWASNPSLQRISALSFSWDGILVFSTSPLAIAGISPHCISPWEDKLMQLDLHFSCTFRDCDGRCRFTNALFQSRPPVVYAHGFTPPAVVKKLIAFIAGVGEFVAFCPNSKTMWYNGFWTFWPWQRRKNVTASPTGHESCFLILTVKATSNIPNWDCFHV